MAFSVNTNAGAMAALQSLNATNKKMDVTQSRINTGLAVSSTKDDSAKYTVAQSLRGDLGGLNAVSSSLNNAKSVTDTAIAGAEQISDLLNQMKSKAYEAADAGLDAASRTAIDKDFTALKGQIGTIIKSSEFNNTNLLDNTFTGTKTVAALQSLDVTSTLAVANQSFDTAVDGAITGGIATQATAQTMVGTLDTVITAVNTSLSDLGAASRKIEGQLKFTSKLSDVVTTGIGNLVDADLAKESANLQALQVQQQLGVQALSIANQAPQTILSLFR
ncbi:flagellin [Sphingomonas koreensis]|uniref:Flagellin n=1 Tax=Sphingomonas koreensis TaxID=93064 RepID=A0A1L6JG70_9SPHN|nr:flagellin [Sphingomonas koreensis]APR54919.1 flagellin [Sphingomonas koreensis]MDC7812887.1 flagellin [Sphingomonas koreensis]PJI87902.1 flagellin [Sphingomonas koreensis]RSU18366.1 flagellin [Sphingomonas koreensis]RSU28671.1 flagellin [Sphingomonas koreensis]